MVEPGGEYVVRNTLAPGFDHHPVTTALEAHCTHEMAVWRCSRRCRGGASSWSLGVDADRHQGVVMLSPPIFKWQYIVT
jgi:hypothetical protein